MSEVARIQVGATPELVGRELEMSALLRALDEARSARGSLFLIGGEPGIGKSRLADEFARRARESGARVLWGRCWEGAGAPAYWPWIQALRAHLRNVDPETARAQLGLGAGDVAQLLPEIRALVPNLPPPMPESDSARFQLFDSTTSLLRQAARGQESVLILDDLHAADTASILLLRFLASQLGDMRLVVVATYRDVELTPEHPLVPALRDMAREPIARLMLLSGFGQEQVRRFIEAIAGKPTPSQLIAKLWRETAGNPLFLSEAVRLMAVEGRLDDESSGSRLRLSLPASIREAMARRVRNLGDATAGALTYGAAIGPEFRADVLRRVGDYGPHELLSLLEEAVTAGLVAGVPGGRFRFSHELVRDAVYAELRPAERARLHRRIAEAIEDIHGDSPDPPLAELTHHYFEAVRGGPTDEARDDHRELLRRAKSYARRAAEQAARSVAYEDAVRLLEIALTLVDLDEQADDGERTELLLALGDAQARAGDLPRARPRFLEAARLARRAGAATQLARAALGYGGRFLWARAGDDRHLVPLLQDALVLLGGSDDRLRVRLLGRLACAWRGSNEHLDQSASLSHEAVELARRLGDPATLSYALVARYGAIYWPDTAAERFEIAKEMIDVAESATDIERMIDARMILSFTYADLARMAEARAEVEALTRLAAQLRQPAQLWLANATRSNYALLAGEFSLAEQLIEVESPPGYPTTPIRDDVSAARMHTYILAREQDRLVEEEPTVRAAVAEFPWYPAHRAALVCLLLLTRRDEEARLLFGELARDGFETLPRDNEWLLSVCLLSEACAMLGDRDAAARLYEELAPYAGFHAIAHAEGSVGIVDRYLGVLAATLARDTEAEAHLNDAVRLNAEMGAHPWRAHSEADLARLLRRRGGAAAINEAEDLERAAAETARLLGMTALAARLSDGAEHDGAGRAAERPATSGTFRREGEYWTIRYGDQSFRLREAKGLQYLARLMAEPGREFLALDLARDRLAPSTARRAAPAELTESGLADAGSQLDDEAKAAYRERLHELQTDLDEAESWNDAERADRARTEMDFLARELARAVGLGGRDRAAGSPTERARLSVTRAIRLAMARIAENSRPLADHLEATIHTGTYCAYRPDPRAAITWEQ